MAKSELERRAEQMRSQIENLRNGIEDLQRSYNRWMKNPSEFLGEAGVPVTAAARTARSTVESAAESMTEAGLPWWVPVAALGAIGAGIWIYNNMLSPRTQHEITHEAHHAMHQMRHMGSEMTGSQTGNREQFPPFRAGEQSSYGMQTPPSTPGQP